MIKKISLHKLFVFINSYLTKSRFASCGKNVRVHPGVILNVPKRMVIGENVSLASSVWLNSIDDKKNEIALRIGSQTSIGRFCHINAYGHVTIEDSVLIAERVHISDCSHHYEDAHIPIMDQGASFIAPVLIKKGAWLGIGAVILPGVTVGENAVVGANAVVTKNVPPNTVARGIPAQIFQK